MSDASSILDSVQPPGSRLLHTLDRISGRPVVAVSIVAADLVWLLYSSVVGFPTRLETIFQTLVAALTLAMVFVIQHTQARQQVVTQRKLDEILWAIPRADNALIALADGDHHELADVHDAHRDARRQAIHIE